MLRSKAIAAVLVSWITMEDAKFIFAAILWM